MQLKGKSSLMEHENMWKTEKGNLKTLSLRFVSF